MIPQRNLSLLSNCLARKKRSSILPSSRNFLFSFIDFFAVSGAKHDNIVALYVENDAIITDAETVTAEFRVGQPFGVLERIFFEAKKCPMRFLTPASSLLMSLTAFRVYTSR
jgi:hypothetical protein